MKWFPRKTQSKEWRLVDEEMEELNRESYVMRKEREGNKPFEPTKFRVALSKKQRYSMCSITLCSKMYLHCLQFFSKVFLNLVTVFIILIKFNLKIFLIDSALVPLLHRKRIIFQFIFFILHEFVLNLIAATDVSSCNVILKLKLSVI